MSARTEQERRVVDAVEQPGDVASADVTTPTTADAQVSAPPADEHAETGMRGVHTLSMAKAITAGLREAMRDDPTKYRTDDEVAYWEARDPITRYRTWLEGRGASAAFFDDVDAEAADVASDLRRRALELPAPTREKIFAHVYSEPHPLMAEELAWLEAYEAGFEGGPA